ncbi:MAG: hypothetical protein ACM3O4_04815 [Ignavibacteriales bacterium]
MENVVQSTGRIESLYQNQMIKNMLERISIKNKDLLSIEELDEINTKFLDQNREYSQKLDELTMLYSYSDEQMQNYVASNSTPTFDEPVIESEQSSLERPKILIKTPPKPFNFQ